MQKAEGKHNERQNGRAGLRPGNGRRGESRRESERMRVASSQDVNERDAPLVGNSETRQEVA